MKRAIVAVGFCLVGLVGFSQASVEVGLKGGLNLTSLNAKEPSTNYDNATGYHFGVYAMVKAASFAVQPEVLYSTRGTDITFDDISGDFKQDFVYLDIPVMAKLYLPLGLNLQAGPQFGLLMSADGTALNEDGEPEDLGKSSFKNADISAALGAGWDAPFGLRFNLRYIIGLSDINDYADAQESAKNRTFQVSVGYKLFKLGK